MPSCGGEDICPRKVREVSLHARIYSETGQISAVYGSKVFNVQFRVFVEVKKKKNLLVAANRINNTSTTDEQCCLTHKGRHESSSQRIPFSSSSNFHFLFCITFRQRSRDAPFPRRHKIHNSSSPLRIQFPNPPYYSASHLNKIRRIVHGTNTTKRYETVCLCSENFDIDAWLRKR